VVSSVLNNDPSFSGKSSASTCSPSPSVNGRRITGRQRSSDCSGSHLVNASMSPPVNANLTVVHDAGCLYYSKNFADRIWLILTEYNLGFQSSDQCTTLAASLHRHETPKDELCKTMLEAHLSSRLFWRMCKPSPENESVQRFVTIKLPSVLTLTLISGS
jgi:hypothetical protein